MDGRTNGRTKRGLVSRARDKKPMICANLNVGICAVNEKRVEDADIFRL